MLQWQNRCSNHVTYQVDDTDRRPGLHNQQLHRTSIDVELRQIRRSCPIRSGNNARRFVSYEHIPLPVRDHALGWQENSDVWSNPEQINIKAFLVSFCSARYKESRIQNPHESHLGKTLWYSFEVYDIFMQFLATFKYNEHKPTLKNIWKLSNAPGYKKYNLTIIIPTDHHLGFQDGGHFEPILISSISRFEFRIALRDHNYNHKSYLSISLLICCHAEALLIYIR